MRLTDYDEIVQLGVARDRGPDRPVREVALAAGHRGRSARARIGRGAAQRGAVDGEGDSVKDGRADRVTGRRERVPGAAVHLPEEQGPATVEPAGVEVLAALV